MKSIRAWHYTDSEWPIRIYDIRKENRYYRSERNERYAVILIAIILLPMMFGSLIVWLIQFIHWLE